MKLKIFFTLFIVFQSCVLHGQDIPKNSYGLQVVGNIAQYKQMVESDSDLTFVNLEKFLPGIYKDIRYATKNNFTGKILYDKAAIFARLPVAKALAKVRAALKPLGLDILLYDAYRPYTITVTMWEYVKDDRYAASPRKGSRHNRGCALDLTLVDLKTGKPVMMPTPYDDFTNKAHDNYNDLPENVIKNRATLRTTMEKFGFSHITSEWWHFDFEHWNKYPLMDISFDDLEKLTN
ncbi:MAG: M15 family metallopeptidase [Ignavibacteriales bacterium]|nr:M15 family metallopeptidase [Ignavibacteriales bacterium]